MEHRLFVSVFAAILVVLFSSRVFGTAFSTTFDGLPPVEFDFDLGCPDGQWTLDSQRGSELVYSCCGHNLALKVEKKGIQSIVRFSLTPPAGRQLAVESYNARITLPQSGLHSVMVPATRPIGKQLEYYHANRKWRENVPLYRCLIPEPFTEKAQVNNEAPVILLSDSTGLNKFCVGWAAANVSTMLAGSPRDDNYVLSLLRKQDVPFSGDKLEDALVISTASKPWMAVETEYARTFDNYNGRRREPVPAWTTDPVFCTWYCYSENIDQQKMLAIARKCKDLGFGTILVDAGWDAKPGVNWGDLDKCAIGDFDASPELFPDLPRMVREMHEMGLRVELWSSPFWYGKGSRNYQQKVKDWMIREENYGETHDICPKHPGTRELFKQQFTRVAREYGIDGMWLDAADGVAPKCVAEHAHLDQSMGQAWIDCMCAIRDGLKSVNPEAITEARILHANLNSKVALDVVQCGDSPKSYEMVRLALIHLKPWAYDIVVKNDPMIWLPDADTATIGKFLATMVCIGVPCLSVDYLTAPEEHCLLTKVWLDFYEQHKDTLLKGEFILFGENYGIPDMLIVGDNEAVVYLTNPKTLEVDLPRSVDKVIVLNCTNQDKLDLKVKSLTGSFDLKSYEPSWKETSIPQKLTGDGELSLSHFVPQGGAAVITKT